MGKFKRIQGIGARKYAQEVAWALVFLHKFDPISIFYITIF